MPSFSTIPLVARPLEARYLHWNSPIVRTFSTGVAAACLLMTVDAGAQPPRFGAAGPWEVIQQSEGITVQRRKIDGSHLHEFQGRGIVEAPLAGVLAVLEDQAQHARQNGACGDVEDDLSPAETRTSILYDRTKAPWPVAERDVVLRAVTVVDSVDREIRIDFRTTEVACLPPRPGIVRMPFMRGHYTLRPVRGGMWTEVEYQVFADPGGALPRWAINMAARKIPFDTLRGLRSGVKEMAHLMTAGAIAARPEYQALMSTVAAAN